MYAESSTWQIILRSRSARDTEAIGERLAEVLQAGDVVALHGPLGVGKTCMARGIVRGLGFAGYVTSPSFTMVNEYQGRLKIYHVDLYRVRDVRELEGLGFTELMWPEDAVTLVEWPERAQEMLPPQALTVRLDWVEGASQDRWIIIGGHGADQREVLRRRLKEICWCSPLTPPDPT